MNHLKSLSLFLLFWSFGVFSNENWKDHWQQALEYYSEKQHQQALVEFDKAINLLAEEDYHLFPYVFLARAENDYILKNYARVLSDTEIALQSIHLTEYERLNCGTRRIAAFTQLEDENAAIEEYKKYIIGCPLFPKYEYSNDKVIIRNIPECTCYQDITKERMMTYFCTQEKDIHKYGNMWVVDRSRCKSIHLCDTDYPSRTPKEIEGCCNTCNKLAVAATFICGCLPIPFGGPITAVACKLSCLYLVEDFRQDCEHCCRYGTGKCWSNFETWKNQFRKKHPSCGSPPTECPK